MNFSKKGELQIKIESLKRETGMTDKEIKKLFVETYLLEDKKTPDEMMSDFLHDSKEEE